MQQIPNDGSYYNHRGKCDLGPNGCAMNDIVRKLSLDKNPEGANVYLCNYHWNKEIQRRRWENEHGVAEPWLLFDFYEANPALVEQEVKPEEPIIYRLSMGYEHTERADLYVASSNESTGSCSAYRIGFHRGVLSSIMEEAKQFVTNLGRTHALLVVFGHIGHDEEFVEARQAIVKQLFDVLATADMWNGESKYA